MIKSPMFSAAAETTTPPQTSSLAAPRPSPPGPASPASLWLHNHAYHRHRSAHRALRQSADAKLTVPGKYWTVVKNGPGVKSGPLPPPLVRRPPPPFLVSAQSEESLRWAAAHDIPFAQIDALVDQARRDQALYREVQLAHGHAAKPRLYLMREIYVGDSDAQAREEAQPHLL